MDEIRKEIKKFNCWEDAMDYIIALYLAEKITLQQRNELFNEL